MKKNLLLLTAFFAVIIAINACKADKPILPGDKGYVAAIPPGGDTSGTGGTGGTGGSINVDTSLLTGNWKVSSTYAGGIQDGSYNKGTLSPVALIPDVTLNNKLKIGMFGTDTTSVPYTATVINKNFYITFATDPFPRSANDKIQVSALSATSMTWIAIDPQVLSIGGHTLQTAVTVIFSK